MRASAAADMITTMTMIIIIMRASVTAVTITTMIMSIITMMENVAVAADMTMITIITIIMQMRCLQAGDGKRRRSIRRKRLKTF